MKKKLINVKEEFTIDNPYMQKTINSMQELIYSIIDDYANNNDYYNENYADTVIWVIINTIKNMLYKCNIGDDDIRDYSLYLGNKDENGNAIITVLDLPAPKEGEFYTIEYEDTDGKFYLIEDDSDKME